MKKKKILRLVATASVVAGGVSLSGNVAKAAPDNTVHNDIDSQNVINNSRSMQKGQVIDISTNLRVRSDASTTSTILGYLNSGDTFEIKAEKGNWYRINFNGKDGYVSKDYTKAIGTSDETTKAKGQVVNVGNSTLRIRQAASTSSAVLGNLKEGDTFEIISKSGQWYNVKSGGTVGFIHGDYVKEISSTVEQPTQPPQENKSEKGQIVGVEGSNLRVRTAPNTSASTYGYLLNGTEVEIIGESGDWYAINYKGQTGYCSKQYVKKTTGNSGSNNNNNNNNNSGNTGNSQNTTFKGEVINADVGLRVRQGATTSSSILGYLYTGNKVDVQGESGSWYKISYKDGTAYVSKNYIKKVDTSSSGNSNSNSGGNDNSQAPVTGTGEIINANVGLRVRSAADTSSSVLGYLYTGDKVDIKGQSGDWYNISYKGASAYVHKDYVKKTDSSNSGSTNNGGSSNIENKRGKVYNTGGTGLTVRTEANTNSLALGYIMEGQVVEITATTGNWYKIIFNNKSGYVSASYIKIVEDSSPDENSSIFEKAFAAMKAQIGSPYVWGGSGEYLTTQSLNTLKKNFPNDAADGIYVRAERYVNKGYRAFDCSGLMQWGFRQAGVVIGRTTWAQIGEGREVAISDIKPGDLLFYSNLGHVGMYIGNGQWIESPNPNADVRISNIPWDKVTRARRILN